MTIFKSKHHPGSATPGWMLFRAQAKPVAIGMLLVMVLTLAAVLQGFYVLQEALLGAGLAILVGSSWGLFSLTRIPAEFVVMEGGLAAVRSIWDVVKRGTAHATPQKLKLSPVWSVRTTSDELLLGVGDTVHSLRRADWPEFDDMLQPTQVAASQFARHTPLQSS